MAYVGELRFLKLGDLGGNPCAMRAAFVSGRAMASTSVGIVAEAMKAIRIKERKDFILRR